MPFNEVPYSFPIHSSKQQSRISSQLCHSLTIKRTAGETVRVEAELMRYGSNRTGRRNVRSYVRAVFLCLIYVKHRLGRSLIKVGSWKKTRTYGRSTTHRRTPDMWHYTYNAGGSVCNDYIRHERRRYALAATATHRCSGPRRESTVM